MSKGHKDKYKKKAGKALKLSPLLYLCTQTRI